MHEQCAKIAYLMTVGYGRKESLEGVRSMLQGMNRDAADLVTQAATNTVAMSHEGIADDVTQVSFLQSTAMSCSY